jgi:hypothetical protein
VRLVRFSHYVAQRDDSYCPISACGSNVRKEREKAIFRSARSARQENWKANHFLMAELFADILFAALECPAEVYTDGGSGPSGCL